ncbi:MAG: thiamine-phosphate kinase [Chloroflexota bacterium]|nr:thiamine-phosphate kinase [Chloroflexota bacterium]
MKVSELGEVGLIERLSKIVARSRQDNAPAWQQLLTGIGDDAAAWRGDAPIQLATVDSLIQDIHFRLGMASWRELGWKALAINLSDIAAMGGEPRYALVSLAVPDSTEVDDVIALYEGIMELARPSGVAIVGGDTNNAAIIVIDVTVIGCAQEKLLTRATAQPGDQIAVTGYLGTAAAGLQMLTQGLKFDPETTNLLRQAFLKPVPRVAEGQLLVKHGVRTAIDISDGLIADLHHVCRASRVSARIDVDLVPIHPAVKASFGEKARDMALSGGEDYELLFTGPAKVISKVKTAASCPVTIIGEITAGKPGQIALTDRRGKPYELGKDGWEHFVSKTSAKKA